MFKFIKIRNNGINQYAFQAINNAAYQVAYLYQLGMIRRDDITYNRFSKVFTVYILNPIGYHFNIGDYYYIDIGGSDEYNAFIQIMHHVGQYVPNRSRYDHSTCSVNSATWSELLNTWTIKPFLLLNVYIDPYVYYGDELYEEELDRLYTLDSNNNIVIKKYSSLCHKDPIDRSELKQLMKAQIENTIDEFDDYSDDSDVEVDI